MRRRPPPSAPDPAAALLFLVALILLAAWVGDSRAHEFQTADGRAVDASWIQKKHPECCGEQDCEPVPQEDVAFTPAGWRVRGLSGAIPIDKVKRSDPGKGPWACRYLYVESRPIRCLFLPGARN